MARELLLGGRSVRVADDRTYRCGLGAVAHVAVRVAQLAIGWDFDVKRACCSSTEIFSLSFGRGALDGTTPTRTVNRAVSRAR